MAQYSTPRGSGRALKVFLGVAFLYGMIDRKSSPLPPVLRSLITVRVSQLNRCRFCVDINSATLLKRGVAFGKVEALVILWLLNCEIWLARIDEQRWAWNIPTVNLPGNEMLSG
jgi:AhpD family alkylhydroperoxidase